LSTKTHQLVDGHGLPLVSICTAGQDGDSPMLAPLLEQLQVGRRTRPDAVLGDKAYSSRANRSLLRSRKIEAVISEPSDQHGHRLRRGSRGGRPPKFDAIKCPRSPQAG
jgi:transposase